MWLLLQTIDSYSPNSHHSHSDSPHSQFIPCIPIIFILAPHIPTLIPAFLSFPSFGFPILHSGFYEEHIPRIPNIPTAISRIPTLITNITTMISRIPTLILCIPIIPLIPFPDSQFRLLQIADSLIFFDVGYKVKKTLKISI